jgi:hypothetical protein
MIGYHRFFALEDREGIKDIQKAVTHLRVLDQHEEETDDSNDDDSKSKHFITCEIVRRTCWSCFILDAYLCFVARIPSCIENLNTQLPCTEYSFTYGITVKTRLLAEDDRAYAERSSSMPGWDFETQVKGVSLFIQALRLFKDVMQMTQDQQRR